jgi:hypothetical protein
MSQSSTPFIGMDVHKDAIVVAYIAQEPGAEVTYLGTIGTRQCDTDQLFRKTQWKAKTMTYSRQHFVGLQAYAGLHFSNTRFKLPFQSIVSQSK